MEERLKQDKQIKTKLQKHFLTPLKNIPKWLKISLITSITIIVLSYAYLEYKTTKEQNNNWYTPEMVYDSTNSNILKIEECYDQVTNVECEEGQVCMTNPASSFCVCMGGTIEIKTNEETEDQYGVCKINEEEYEEWEYFRSQASQEVENTTSNITEQELTQGWYWGSLDQKKPGTPDNWIHSDEGTRSAKWYKPEDTELPAYTIEYSEGTCTTDSECIWAGEGCGGGHGMCTNEPEKYEDAITTCDIVENFPSNLGYTCGCIETISKCGWKK